MAQTENGVGISFKLADGTMVWARRDDWVELLQDIKAIRGEVFTESLENHLRGQQADAAAAVLDGPVTNATTDETITPAQAAAILGSGTTNYQTCGGCGQPKDKLVPAGVSKKTGKRYNAFHVCQTRGCPGR